MVSLTNSSTTANANIKFINSTTSNAFIGVGGNTSTTLNSSYQNNLFLHSGCNIILNAGNNSTATNPHLFLDKSGNIGIGSSAPQYKLDVNGASRVYDSSAATSAEFYIGNGTKSSSLNLWDGPGAAWRLYTTSSNLLFTNGNSAAQASMVEKMRITPDGNVGIGTNAPNYKLDVNGNILCRNGNGNSAFTNNQLLDRERFYIELNKDICVNKCIPNRTRKEYYQAYRIKLIDYQKQYRENNKDNEDFKAKNRERKRKYYERKKQNNCAIK
jgi:hypothetical protein